MFDSFWAMTRQMVSRFRLATRNKAKRVITWSFNHYNAPRPYRSITIRLPIEGNGTSHAVSSEPHE